MRPVGTSVLTLAIMVPGSPPVAQPEIAARTAVSLVGGAASAASTTGVAMGGSWLFDLNDRAAVEAQGTYDGHWGVGRMPRFYARRLGPIRVPAGDAWEARSFTDPAVTMGGGIRFNVSEHLMVRPEIRALVVVADGATHTVALLGVQLGYRF